MGMDPVYLAAVYFGSCPLRSLCARFSLLRSYELDSFVLSFCIAHFL